jgi:hypothetical protein
MCGQAGLTSMTEAQEAAKTSRTTEDILQDFAKMASTSTGPSTYVNLYSAHVSRTLALIKIFRCPLALAVFLSNGGRYAETPCGGDSILINKYTINKYINSNNI